MRMVKKSLIALLSIATAFSVVGCSSGGTNEKIVKGEESQIEANAEAVETSADEDTADTEVTEEPTYDFEGQVVKVHKGRFDNLNNEEPEWVERRKMVEEKYNIALELVEIPTGNAYNVYDEMIKASASGEALCDLADVGRDYLQKLVMNDTIVDLTDAVGSLKLASRYIDHGKWLNSYWGVGQYNIGETSVLTYDRDVIEQLGMAKTPTDMFMEGKWDYASFKEYLTQLKSKLPEGQYPFGIHPYTWTLFAAQANGVSIVDDQGKLNTMDPAFIEALDFLKELLNEGLAKPCTFNQENQAVWDASGSVLKMSASWEITSLEGNWGLTLMPWGSSVTCDGDYTTLSDNYKTTYNDGGMLVVMNGAIERTGIPADVLINIAWDYANGPEGNIQYMKDFYEDDLNGIKDYNPNKGLPRNFCTEQDIEIFDWGFGRVQFDNATALERTKLVNIWGPALEIMETNVSTRATFEAAYQKDKAALETIGLKQD